jgi:hypothetical protein
MNFMRIFRLLSYILGYILLIGGFVSMNLKTFAGREITMGVVVEQWQRMPQEQSYTREYVRDTVEKAASTTWRRTAPPILNRAWIMIVGGILIDIGARRKRTREQI